MLFHLVKYARSAEDQGVFSFKAWSPKVKGAPVRAESLANQLGRYREHRKQIDAERRQDCRRFLEKVTLQDWLLLAQPLLACGLDLQSWLGMLGCVTNTCSGGHV